MSKMQKFATTATDEIILSDGSHVIVRQSLSAAELARMQNRAMRMEIDISTGVVKPMELDYFTFKLETVRAYLVSWDFTDDNEDAVEYSPALVDSLNWPVIDEIIGGIERLQQGKAEAHEKKESKRSNKR